MSFDARWAEFDASRVSDPDWEDVWALTCRALVSGGGTREVESYLWRWRWSGWILQLDQDIRTCKVCGGSLGEEVHGRRTSCGDACRQLRARCRAKGEPTPWAVRVNEAREVRAQLEDAGEAARKWLVRRRVLHPGSVVLPPNWASMRSAPVLPPRCDRACDASSDCTLTGGGPCLFAAVGRVE